VTIIFFSIFRSSPSFGFELPKLTATGKNRLSNMRRVFDGIVLLTLVVA
jgi:hypothetical protein